MAGPTGGMPRNKLFDTRLLTGSCDSFTWVLGDKHYVSSLATFFNGYVCPGAGDLDYTRSAEVTGHRGIEYTVESFLLIVANLPEAPPHLAITADASQPAAAATTVDASMEGGGDGLFLPRASLAEWLT